jgi:hypothetical protein
MLNIFLVVLLGHFLSIPDSVSEHAVYLSVAEVLHIKGKGDSSIKIKVFTNDIEDAVANEFHQRIKLADTSAFELQRASLQEYFNNHFQISVNQKRQVLTLHRSEVNGDAIWFYFKMTSASNWEEVLIKADYLMELFPTQSNVISIEHDTKKQFVRLTNAKKSETVRF